MPASLRSRSPGDIRASLTPTNEGEIQIQTEEIASSTSEETASDEGQLSTNEPTNTTEPTTGQTRSTADNITDTPPPASGDAQDDTQMPSNTPVVPTTAQPPTVIPSPTETLIQTQEPDEEDQPPVVCDPGASSAFEAEVISLINAERGKEGLTNLSIHSQLTTAARIHSDDMACNAFFSHTSSTTGTPFDRIAAAGYSYSAAGENIAAGYGTPAALVEGWMESEGHRDNILSPSFTHIGLGYAFWGESAYGFYWTAVFASP